MSIFVDTSAFFAGLDADDRMHESARESWSRLVSRRVDLVAHALVETETCALAQRRLGVPSVAVLRDEFLSVVRIEEIDRIERRAAVDLLVEENRRDLSLVDRVSFSFMRRLGITTAFAFDRHFAEAGFELVGPEDPS